MLGDLISAGSNLISGFMANNRADEDRQTQMAIAQQNVAMQREFAQNGIRWKVADATAAGLHPLAALGAQTSSFSPVSVGSSGDGGASHFANFGQDIGRAVKAAQTAEERAQRDAETARKLDVEKKGLENGILRTELVSKIRRETDALGPSFPGGRVPLPRPGPERTWSGDAISDDKIEQKSSSDFPVKKLNVYGVPVEMPSWLSSGQDWEDALGEVGGSGMGLVNLPGIVGYNLYKHIWPELQRVHAANRSGSAARRRRASRPWGE